MSLSSFVVKNLALEKADDSHPREAILKHAEVRDIVTSVTQHGYSGVITRVTSIRGLAKKIVHILDALIIFRGQFFCVTFCDALT